MNSVQPSQSVGSSAESSSAGPSSDALSAFETALVKAAQASPGSTADPHISAAFALGWQMSELYRLHRLKTKQSPKDLPGLGTLKAAERTTILIDQIKTNANKLSGPIDEAGLGPGMDLALLQSLVGEPATDDPVLHTHVQVLADLTAADFRLGKAYGLGRALADTCHAPRDKEKLLTQLKPSRVANLLGWLDDLASVLPAHSANSVAKSLRTWRDAVHPEARPQAVKLNIWKWVRARWNGDRHYRHKPPTPVDLKHGVRALQRQGEIWRALLSGEKCGTDMLGMNNYLDAMRELSSRLGAIARGVISRMPLMSLLVAVLVAGGIALIAGGSSSQIAGGATSILVAFGLTWKGLGSAAGKLIGKVEKPLWGAVLDDAIADAITVLPDNHAVGFDRRRVATDVPGQLEPNGQATAPSDTTT